MSEYLIEIVTNDNVTHVAVVDIKDRKKHSLIIASAAGYKHCTKFKSKPTAIKLAEKIDNARVVPSYGGYINSTKSSVAPIQSKVNGTKPYRTI